MPDLLLEVLQLEVRLPPAWPPPSTGRSCHASAQAWPEGGSGAEASPQDRLGAAGDGDANRDPQQEQSDTPDPRGVFCEVAPTWDRFWSGEVGDFFCTSTATPDADGCIVWKVDSSMEVAEAEAAMRLEPLVAFLVAVPPPGGVANLTNRRLGIAVHPALSSVPSLGSEGGELEVPLRPLIAAGAGELVALHGCTADKRTRISMIVSWLPAPPQMRKLFGQSASTHCESERAHECDASQSPAVGTGAAAASAARAASTRRKKQTPCRPREPLWTPRPPAEERRRELRRPWPGATPMDASCMSAPERKRGASTSSSTCGTASAASSTCGYSATSSTTCTSRRSSAAGASAHATRSPEQRQTSVECGPRHSERRALKRDLHGTRHSCSFSPAGRSGYRGACQQAPAAVLSMRLRGPASKGEREASLHKPAKPVEPWDEESGPTSVRRDTPTGSSVAARKGTAYHAPQPQAPRGRRPASAPPKRR